MFTLDESDLESIALRTGGKYYRAETTQQIKDAFSDLTTPGKIRQNFPVAIPLMFFSFFFVFVDWALSITRYRSIP